MRSNDTGRIGQMTVGKFSQEGPVRESGANAPSLLPHPPLPGEPQGPGSLRKILGIKIEEFKVAVEKDVFVTKRELRGFLEGFCEIFCGENEWCASSFAIQMSRMTKFVTQGCPEGIQNPLAHKTCFPSPKPKPRGDSWGPELERSPGGAIATTSEHSGHEAVYWDRYSGGGGATFR